MAEKEPSSPKRWGGRRKSVDSVMSPKSSPKSRGSGSFDLASPKEKGKKAWQWVKDHMPGRKSGDLEAELSPKKVSYTVSSKGGGGKSVADNLFLEAYQAQSDLDLELAKEKYRKIVNVYTDYPMFASAAYNLAILVCDDERTDNEEALEMYRLAIKAKPDHVNANFNYACTLQMAGRYREAMGQFRHTLTIDPNHEPSKEALVYLLKPTMNRGFVGKPSMSVDSWMPGYNKEKKKRRHSMEV